MANRKPPASRVRTSPQPPKPASRITDQARARATECADLASLPVKHTHAAGIDVGDSTHWVCVDATPDGSDTVREFPAHTPGLRELIAWLRLCGVTTVALEASGVYGHVLLLTFHTRKGKNRAARAFRLAAWSLMRSQSYLGAHLRRQRSRLGAPQAITATAHKLARIVYHLVRYGLAYVKQTEAAYAEQVHKRLEKQLRRRAKELGYELRPIEKPVSPEVADPATTTA